MAADLEARGVADRVTIRGHVPNAELPAVYADHDLFVYPGLLDEPFGRVFLESLAAGTPVVASDVGAVAEIVGRAGVVAAPTAEALAGAVRETAEGGKLEEHAAACRTEASRYAPDVVGPAFRRLYERVAGPP